MKTILRYSIILFFAVVASFFTSCKKDIIDRTTVYPALAPSNLDLNADTWKPVLITDPEAFSVPAPDAVNSPAYIADLNEIKGYQRNLTSDQRAIIKYWSAGAVLRWNQILRQLVAKYNLAPYQNPDGTYPAPSSANPFNYPQFPFSNPPFAARAYAYVSAAQYDALIAAYHFKKLYNRPAPYKNDAGIQALIPQSDLPSYPSEDAVVSGAAVEMMKLLFPTEIAYIEQKAAEEKQYRVMAGANVRGELDAGESLGKQVADVFTARARTDKAGAAIGTPAYWAQLATQTTAKGEIAWISLESPRRPPMLPLFTKVKPFLFDTLTVVALRPGPPHATGSAEFKKDNDEVLSYTKNATRANKDLTAFWADGIGTYTPPGHWNAIAADEFVKQNYSEVRWARNFALLNMAEMDAAIVCWDTKYFYFNPRPTQINDQIKTLTGIPNFPSYSSGHSNFSAAAATVLTYLLPDRGNKFTNMAQQAALSRFVSGIHTRQDIEVGLMTGAEVGQYAVQRGMSDGAGISSN
ncbi:phosphatase PAP2 family protein [Mucilaginibacter ginsenosidivorans]|uniref:Phosphatase PAP2 family protein n=1 Tax=Mucilaginibacter ginsenosidivorans TaxID=398053 RepID=A0A5B8UZD0_9SPHI|nr:phosphatase PAP2 family protein [Mucilaginibacter ginsenosidivorans]QEC64115.1 phosphatase PAP2 family protein [Mucilaginibacter ginsenosidivorans]